MPGFVRLAALSTARASGPGLWKMSNLPSTKPSAASAMPHGAARNRSPGCDTRRSATILRCLLAGPVDDGRGRGGAHGGAASASSDCAVRLARRARAHAADRCGAGRLVGSSPAHRGQSSHRDSRPAADRRSIAVDAQFAELARIQLHDRRIMRGVAIANGRAQLRGRLRLQLRERDAWARDDARDRVGDALDRGAIEGESDVAAVTARWARCAWRTCSGAAPAAAAATPTTRAPR